MSTTREKYIREGIITPCAYPGYPVRQTLIETGIVRPAPKDVPMAQIYRDFLHRWYSKPSRRWEGPRNRNGVWV